MDVGDIILLGFLLLTLIFEFVVLLKLFERKHKWSGVLFRIEKDSTKQSMGTVFRSSRTAYSHVKP
jgi:hypothetical protein